MQRSSIRTILSGKTRKSKTKGAKVKKEVRENKKNRATIILIPGVSGNTGEGLSAVRRSVEKAVGSDIFND